MGPIGFPETSVTFKKKDDCFPPSQKPEIRRCSDHLLQSDGLCFGAFQRCTDLWSSHACDSQLGVFISSWINHFYLKFRSTCKPSVSQLCSCVHCSLLSTTVAETLHTQAPGSLSCPRAESMMQCVTSHQPLRNDLRYVGHIDGHISSS